MAQSNKRLDNERRKLRKGESQRKDGKYDYRWTDRTGNRHSVYANTLDELREKEAQIAKDISDGIKVESKNVKVNDVYNLWCDIKRGLKDNTFQNYKYMYDTFVAPDFGKNRISTLKKTDVKRFYNMLADERCMQASTIDSIHTVLHQVLDMAVDDGYIRVNPSDRVLTELKKAHNMGVEKKKALTADEQKLFLNFLKTHREYNHWYPIFAVMLGTGLRVGEVTGLRWCDVDFDDKTIDINHTLVYYNHAENGCYFSVNTPKTAAGKRTVPMLDFVADALKMEKENQELNEIVCTATVDCYTDFIFLNRFGGVQHQGTLNKAIRRIIRDCNDEVLAKAKDVDTPVLLPRFSCHTLRHSFTTRLCEAGVNIKVIQDTLGHSDISTTMNIYADCTKELKKKEFDSFEKASDLWAM